MSFLLLLIILSGLPEYCEESFQELSRAWNEHQAYPLQPVTLLCSLVKTVDEAEHLTRQWKLSNAERALGKFITEHRVPKQHEHPLKPYQDLIVSAPNIQAKNVIKGHVVELLHYQGQHNLAQEINNWDVPVFPITGAHLKKLGVKPGPEFGKMLGKLKELWRDSYYTANEEDLLEKCKTFKDM